MTAAGTVMTFYRFTERLAGRLAERPAGGPDAEDGLAAHRSRLEGRARSLDLKGTILLASEGINGTVCGSPAALERFAGVLRQLPGCASMPIRVSAADPDNPVFHRLKVRIKAEIVALGRPEAKPARRTGIHVDAQAWNALLDDPDVLVIDTRNGYEIAIGSFPGAVDPGTSSFRQFPDFVAGLDPARQPKVAMFCTGGIRCEKASAFMLERGFETVYQLDGGILNYLETVDPRASRWQGECFVFDQRVSVDSDLAEGSYEQCFACRRPLAAADLAHPHYVQGVSCGYCHDERDAADREGFRERQRQVELAAERGERHVGLAMAPAAERDPSRR